MIATDNVVSAIEENLLEAMKYFGRLPQAEVHDDPHMMWFITGIPLPQFNGVVSTRLSTNRLNETIEETLARFKSRGMPMKWWISPSTRPANIGVSLEAHGMIYAGDSPGMAVDLTTINQEFPRPDNLSIARVRSRQEIEDFVRVLVEGYGAPDFAGTAFVDFFSSLGLEEHLPVRHYIGSMDGIPVASCTMFLGTSAAGIYNVATIPKSRRQGIGTAMTMFPLLEARAMQYRLAVLNSSELGVGIYQRLGFKEYCRVSSYEWWCGQ